MKTFPIRVHPACDEDLRDWFLRLEISNHHTESIWVDLLVEEFGYQINLDVLNFSEDPNLLGFLAQLGRLDLSDLPIFPYREYAEILSDSDNVTELSNAANQTLVRFIDKTICICPLCLQESLHIRKYWHLNFVALCSKHRAWLISDCLTCGKAWKWRDVLTNQCPNCMGKATVYRDELEVSVATISHAHKFLDEIFEPLSGLGLIMPQLGKSKRFLLLFGLTELVSRVSPEWPYHFHHNFETSNLEFCSPKRLARFLNYVTAYQALDQWPTGFYYFLDQFRLRHGKSEQRGLNREFGAFHSTWIRNRWTHSDFKFLQEAFKTYLENEFIPYEQFKKADFAQKNPSVLTKSNFVTLDQAAVILNESLAGVLKYIFSGQLHLFRAKYEPIEYLKKSDVERLKASLK